MEGDDIHHLKEIRDDMWYIMKFCKKIREWLSLAPEDIRGDLFDLYEMLDDLVMKMKAYIYWYPHGAGASALREMLPEVEKLTKLAYDIYQGTQSPSMLGIIDEVMEQDAVRLDRLIYKIEYR